MAEEKSSTNASGDGKSSASSGAPGYKFPEALLKCHRHEKKFFSNF